MYSLVDWFYFDYKNDLGPVIAISVTLVMVFTTDSTQIDVHALPLPLT